MNLFQTVIVSVACSFASVFAYDRIFVVEPTQIAVANYDMALSVINDPNEALAALRYNSSILSAAGYVVIDSRVLLGYPGEAEIPSEALKAQLNEPKGNKVPNDAALDLGDTDE